jgi:hypothetical protein
MRDLWEIGYKSGKVLMMGDREKGEEAATSSIFPDAPKASCLYHIQKNMETSHIRCNKANRHIWYKVATVASIVERDEWWELLRQSEPRQYEYLSGIEPAKWQNCVQMGCGLRTFNSHTNNVAEWVGASLCKVELDFLPIRFRAPYAMIEGIIQMFSDKSCIPQGQAQKLLQDNIKYSDYALC